MLTSSTRRNQTAHPADNPAMPPGSTRSRGRPRTLSAAEALLWSHLRSQQLEGWRFFRRTPSSSAGPATTFVCPDASLSIEVDASSSTSASADNHSDNGPLTFTSFEVLATTEAVLSAILVALRTALARRRTN
jgi:very-short-patch-repair endonuclease